MSWSERLRGINIQGKTLRKQIHLQFFFSKYKILIKNVW